MKVNTDRSYQWRSAKTIASYVNLPINRVIYICFIHDKIVPKIEDKKTVFGIKGIAINDGFDNIVPDIE